MSAAQENISTRLHASTPSAMSATSSSSSSTSSSWLSLFATAAPQGNAQVEQNPVISSSNWTCHKCCTPQISLKSLLLHKCKISSDESKPRQGESLQHESKIPFKSKFKHSTVAEKVIATRPPLAQGSKWQKWLCSLCGRMFYSEAKLKLHLVAHTTPGYRCTWPGCGFFYADHCSTTRHIKTHFRSDPAHVDRIPKDFLEKINPSAKQDNESYVGTHLVKPNNNKLDCHLCGRQIVNAVQLMHHIEQHTKAGYRCLWDGCGFFYSLSSKVVEKHIKMDHFGNDSKYAIVDPCGFVSYVPPNAYSNEQLISNKRILDEDPPRGDASGQTSTKRHKAQSSRDPIPVNLTCRVCAKIFPNPPTLYAHFRSKHTEQMPYYCRWPDCEFVSFNECYTVGHIRSEHTHTNVSSYVGTRTVMPNGKRKANTNKRLLIDNQQLGDSSGKTSTKRYKEQSRRYPNSIMLPSLVGRTQTPTSTSILANLEKLGFSKKFPSLFTNKARTVSSEPFKQSELAEPIELSDSSESSKLSELIEQDNGKQNPEPAERIGSSKPEEAAGPPDTVKPVVISESKFQIANSTLSSCPTQALLLLPSSITTANTNNGPLNLQPVQDRMPILLPLIGNSFSISPIATIPKSTDNMMQNQTAIRQSDTNIKYNISSNSSMFQQSNKITVPSLTCRFCAKQFANQLLLNAHYRYEHHEQMPFYCKYIDCMFGSFDINETVFHIRSRHSVDKYSVSNYVGTRSVRPIGTVEPMRKVTKRTFKETQKEEEVVSIQTGTKRHKLLSSNLNSFQLLSFDAKPQTTSSASSTSILEHRLLMSKQFVQSSTNTANTSSSYPVASNVQPISQIVVKRIDTVSSPDSNRIHILPIDLSKSAKPIELAVSTEPTKPLDEDEPINLSMPAKLIKTSKPTEPTEGMVQDNDPQCHENSPNNNSDLSLFSNDLQIKGLEDNQDESNDNDNPFSSNSLFDNENVDNDNVEETGEVNVVAETGKVDDLESMEMEHMKPLELAEQVKNSRSASTLPLTGSAEPSGFIQTADINIETSAVEVSREVQNSTLRVTPSTQAALTNLQSSPLTSALTVSNDQLSEPKQQQQKQSQKHDSHCFECHKKVTDSEEYQHCSLCPLTYHSSCIERENLFKKQQLAIERYNALENKQEEDENDDDGINNLQTQPSVCDECVLKIVGKRFNRSKDGFACTGGSYNVDVETTFHNIANLLINKVNTWKIRGYKKLIKADQYKDKGESECQCAIMDLETIESKAKEYRSIDEILFDVKMVIHQRLISSKFNKHVEYNCTKLWDQVIEEVRHIYLCDSCYRLFYKEDNKNLPKTFYKGPTTYGKVFLLACQSPHPVVWVQIDGQWWPGKVFPNYTECSFEIATDLVQVVTFGPQIRRTVEASLLYDYSSEIPENGQLENENQQLAVQEAEYYLTKQDSDIIDYSISKSSRPYERGNFYINTKPDATQLQVVDQNDESGDKIKWKCSGCRKRLANRRLDSCTVSFCSKRCRKKFLLR